MWLLPIFPRFASFAVRLFYRLEVAGERVPRRGPVLLVANHPNALVDPGAVAAVAGRPVRFLTKAPLFSDPLVGWLVRGSGAIPVYRQSDDPGQMRRNEDAFRAVHAALAEGAAVGIFPEGTSHSQPGLVPIRTGAARIALGAAERLGGAFPVVPVGLTFREKETFRTEALVVVGRPVAWDDLADAGLDDPAAVRALTARIARGLEAVTAGLERWEDAPLVETAEAVYAAERPVPRAPDARLARHRATARVLARLRAADAPEWRALARDLAAHARILRVVGMRPHELKSSPGLRTAAAWTARQAAYFAVGVPLAALGIATYWLPYRLTGVVEGRVRPERDARATHKVLVGGVLHLAWTLALAGLAGWWAGWWGAAAAVVVLPLAGIVALHALERGARAVAETRRVVFRTRRRALLAQLRARQEALAVRLEAVWREERS